MIRRLTATPLSCVAAAAICAAAQQGAGTPDTPEDARQLAESTANPGRPTVSTPATLIPVGSLQFETGTLGALYSPECSSQSSFNEVVKFAVRRRVELLAVAGPFAHSRAGNETSNQTGDVLLGVQGVVHQGAGARPTIALSYLGRVHSGPAPNLDIGSARNMVLLLAGADVRGFHYDTNFFFNEVLDDATHRVQFGQTLSVSHPLAKDFGISGELWHFTQPFLRSHAVGTLWAVNYNMRTYLVFDCGFDRGLTNTSTRWEAFVGFTYLLPHGFRRSAGHSPDNSPRKELPAEGAARGSSMGSPRR